MVQIKKPSISDLKQIEKILAQWTDLEEVQKYVKRISDEVNEQTQFNMCFWVAKKDGHAIGIAGLADALPKVLYLAKTKKPGEVKILYVDKKHLKTGVGKMLTQFLEKEAKRQGYSELIVRSAEKYQDTAWGFYDRLDYKRIGKVAGGDRSKEMQVFGKEL
ncbi:GNAT family N-acetyltransferase [Patescibacteria group bacterium]